MTAIFRHKFRKTPIEKLLLFTVAGIGVLAAAAVSPALGILLKEYGLKQKLYPRLYASNALFRLRRKGFIQLQTKREKKFFVLTETEIGRAHV